MSIRKITKESVSKILEIDENLALATSSTGNIQLGEGAGGLANGRGIAIGYQSAKNSPDRDMVAVGSLALNTGAGQYAVGVGYFAGLNNAGNESIAIGLRANESSGGQRSIALGTEASSAGTQAIAVGKDTTSSSTNTIAIGEGASATASEAIALGHDTTSAASKSTALGVDANSSHASSTAIGTGATTTATNQIMLGTSNQTVVVPGPLAATTITGYIDYSPAAFIYGHPFNGAVVGIGTNGTQDMFELTSSGSAVTPSVSTLGKLVVKTGVSMNVDGATVSMTIFENPTVAEGGDGRTRVAMISFHYIPNTGSATPVRLGAIVVKTNPDGNVELPQSTSTNQLTRVMSASEMDSTPTVGATTTVVLAEGDGFGIARTLNTGYGIYEAIVTGVLL